MQSSPRVTKYNLLGAALVAAGSAIGFYSQWSAYQVPQRPAWELPTGFVLFLVGAIFLNYGHRRWVPKRWQRLIDESDCSAEPPATRRD